MGLAAQFMTDQGYAFHEVAAMDHNERVTRVHQMNHGGRIAWKISMTRLQLGGLRMLCKGSLERGP